MKKIAVTVALLSVSILASCSSIDHDVHSTLSWAHGGSPSSVLGNVPTGYPTDQSDQMQQQAPAPQQEPAAPQAMQQPAPAPQQEDYAAPSPPPAPQQQAENVPPTPYPYPLNNYQNLIWSHLGSYSATKSRAPTVVIMPPPVEYNTSVEVYPVNGDMAPYTSVDRMSQQYRHHLGSGYRNARVEQVYFPYGSAKVAAADRENLRELVRSLLRQSDMYTLTVVGHSSNEVAGKGSGISKQIANYSMGKKRAEAVSHVLIGAGAARRVVTTRSVGATEPAEDLHGMSQQSADQRADVFLDAN